MTESTPQAGKVDRTHGAIVGFLTRKL